MTQRADDPRHPTAHSFFVDWLARHEAGERPDFEALCEDHPEQAERLRELHARWLDLKDVLAQAGLGGTLSEKLETRYGSGVDPHVTLQKEERARGDLSSEVLARLEARGPASRRYRLKGEIAHGGMGAILRAWDEDLRRHLAMKVILGQARQEPAGDTPGVDRRVLARFLEEAQVTGQLEHPGIVPVHELGLDGEGRVYFTMKLVEGSHFGDVLELVRERRGGWTQTRALSVIQKVCDAMAYAHSRGVVHRDLKPANVMVGRFGEVYVMDWGLARILGQQEGDQSRVESERQAARELDPHSELHTVLGQVMGTPAYMPPEQALGRINEITPPSDVYAVGAMLYHLLAGHPPYVGPGSAPTHGEVWQRVRSGPPAALLTEAREAPAELIAICEKAMSRDARARYPDMSALAGDLAAYVERRVVSAYETGAWAEARKWVQRNKPLAAALAAAVVAVVAGGIAFAVKADEATKAAALAREEARRADNKTMEAQENLVLAQQNEAEAKAQQQRAEENERLARAETAKVLRLSDVKVLQELVAEADGLWPAYPDKITAMQSWSDRARALVGNLPAHRETLAQMRGRAHPWSNEERARDRERHPRAGELGEKQAELSGLIAQLEQGLSGEAQATGDKRIAELEPEIAALMAAVESRRTWSFGSAEDQWQHDVLAELIGNLEGFIAGLLADDAITADHGWSVPKRLAFAQEMEAGFGQGGEYARVWAEALPAICEDYPRLDLKPQMGMLPIGPDPESGLWEFAHLMTGVPAERGADGKLMLTEETGVVLVLLPGGSFLMGAQSDDPNGENFDPQVQPNEGPVHEASLSAYFLSKYELTQGQWERLTGRNPSNYSRRPDSPTLIHPVEVVSWNDCVTWLPRAGLLLPSEAQWEYGARGNTRTPWWTGAERDSLRVQHAANLADRAAGRAGATWPDIDDWPTLDDGFVIHAPVGTFAANPFGLHEVTGNLWELCLDGYQANYEPSPSTDPVTPWSDTPVRVYRGGGFDRSAREARSASRRNATPTGAAGNLGVRPARSIAP